jgi:hypothetical protein
MVRKAHKVNSMQHLQHTFVLYTTSSVFIIFQGSSSAKYLFLNVPHSLILRASRNLYLSIELEITAGYAFNSVNVASSTSKVHLVEERLVVVFIVKTITVYEIP